MALQNYKERRVNLSTTHREIEKADVGNKSKENEGNVHNKIFTFANVIITIELHFEGEDLRDMIRVSIWELVLYSLPYFPSAPSVLWVKVYATLLMSLSIYIDSKRSAA